MSGEYVIGGLYFGFMPSWWHGNYGVTYGKRMIFDPDYRTDALMFMDRTLFERFPEFNVGSENPKPRVSEPDFANTLIPATAGCEVIYPENRHPWSKHLEPEKIEKLKLPENIEDVFPYSEIYSQYKYLNNKLNENATPYFHGAGIQNNAVLIRGEDLFTDYYEDPESAAKVLDYCSLILTQEFKHCYDNFGRRDWLILLNCTHELISTGMYEEWIAPYESKLYKLANELNLEFALHHCGKFDRYADVYRKHKNVNFLEIGSDSDVRLALEKFPEATFNYIFSAKLLATADRKTIREKTNQILEDSKGNWHRFRIAVADIDYGTPDENLYEIYECCKKGPGL